MATKSFVREIKKVNKKELDKKAKSLICTKKTKKESK